MLDGRELGIGMHALQPSICGRPKVFHARFRHLLFRPSPILIPGVRSESSKEAIRE